MASLQTFHKTLSDIVSSDKLSSSRVEKIRNEAADNFDRADELVKIIRKVHNAASTKTRISSLYLFDAMARCAQDIIKRKASGFRYKDAKPPKGSASIAGSKEAMIDSANSFLGACVDVVEEIVLTTAQSVREDQREKVAKVVDIWIKANTFDQSMLGRIRAKALRGEGISQTSAMSNEDGKGNSMPSPYGMLMNDVEEEDERLKNPAKSPPPTTVPNVPANLLAMLGAPPPTAATKTQIQGTSNPTEKPAAASLDPNQLAMLRRVAAQQQQEQQQQGLQQGRQRLPSKETYQGSGPGGSQGSRDRPLPIRTDNTTSAMQPHHLQSADHHGIGKESFMNDENSKGNFDSVDKSSSPHFWPDESVGDLSQFDISIFDPTKSDDWLKLAQQWFNTYQYIPCNQELLMGLMSVMQSQMYMQQQMMSGSGGMENESIMNSFMTGGGNDMVQEGNGNGGSMQNQYSNGWD